jgi:cystathionine gamma-synthase
MHPETVAVHAGRAIDPPTGAVTPPIHLSTTFERSADGTYPRGFEYTRETNPNRRSLEECLAALEGGTEALCFASGMAAAHAVFQGLHPGDHVLLADDIYYGIRRLLGEVMSRAGLDVTVADMADLAGLQAAIRPETRLIWTETPSNPMMKVTDLAAIGDLARARNIMTVCDSTFAPPPCQRPLDHNIDLVMHSSTKYLGGHSDVLGGVLVTRHPNYLFERARTAQMVGGAVPSPFDCWLLLRSLQTLPVRMRAHCDNAAAIAAFLCAHPRVEKVCYAGLPNHPGHQIAARQMKRFGGMLSFQVRGGKPEAMAVAARTLLFTRATSLGGVHSLIEHRASIEGRASRTPQNLLRVSVGIEHPDDLIADLDQALAV